MYGIQRDNAAINEPSREKNNNLDFEPGQTKTDLSCTTTEAG